MIKSCYARVFIGEICMKSCYEIFFWNYQKHHVMGNHIRRGIAVITYKSKL